jgi:hypothetical protein
MSAKVDKRTTKKTRKKRTNPHNITIQDLESESSLLQNRLTDQDRLDIIEGMSIYLKLGYGIVKASELASPVHHQTIYRWIKRRPLIQKKLELLRITPNLMARKNWIDKIDEGDYLASKEWLQANEKDTFGKPSDTINNNINIASFDNISPEDRESAIMARLNALTGKDNTTNIIDGDTNEADSLNNNKTYSDKLNKNENIVKST